MGLCLSSQAFAHQAYVQSINEDKTDWKLYAELDAPNLIRITDNIHAGAAVGHDFNQTNIQEGNYAIGKITVSQCVLNCK